MEQKAIEGELIYVPQDSDAWVSSAQQTPESSGDPAGGGQGPQEKSTGFAAPVSRQWKPNPPMMIAACAAAVFLAILIAIFNTPANRVGRAMDFGNYAKGVAIYNEKIAGDEKLEQAAFSSVDEGIRAIQTAFGRGRMSADDAIAALNDICRIENEALALMAEAAISDVVSICNGQTLAEQGNYADAIAMYQRVAPLKPLRDTARRDIEACVDRLMNVAEREQDVSCLQQILDAAALVKDDADMAFLVKQMEPLAMQLLQTNTQALFQTEEYRQALALSGSGAEVYPDNQMVQQLLADCQLQYEQFISSRVSQFMGSSDYVSARTLVEQVLQEDPDNPTFLDLQRLVNRAQGNYTQQISTQVDSYISGGRFGAAFAVIGGLLEADPGNTAYQALEESALEAYEAHVSESVRALMGDRDYAAALLLAGQAAKRCPDNTVFRELEESVRQTKNQYETGSGIFTNGAVTFRRYESTITRDDKEDLYTLDAKVDGYYRLYVENMSDGMKVSMAVYDAATGSLIHSSLFGYGNGGGTVKELAAGSYTVKISHYSGTGGYRLVIGSSKPAADVSGYTRVCDSIEYSGQRNRYTFTPTRSGLYRIDLENMVRGFEVSLSIRDSLQYPVAQNSTGFGTGEGLTAELAAGETYEIEISSHAGTGDYELVIGRQRARGILEEDISLTDEITFKDQRIEYSFVPARTGRYTFCLDDMLNSMMVDLKVTNSLNKPVASSGIGLSSGESIWADLEAGETYTLILSHSIDTGAYTLAAYCQEP